MTPLLIAALSPLVQVGGPITSWLISLALLAIAVLFVIWLVTKFAGPPSIPEPMRWVVWVIVAIALLIAVFAALGLSLP